MKGYTLIEVLIAVFILVIILVGGTNLYFQNLKSSGLSNVTLNLNSSLNRSVQNIARDIRFGDVLSVGMGTRNDCIAAGDTGFAGTTLRSRDLQGLDTIYQLQQSRIASVSAYTNSVVYLTPSDIDISRLNFVWFCSGSGDLIRVEVEGQGSASASGITIIGTASAEIDLLNSGIN